ncbi:MAG: tryptophan dimethylallyltransferase family protein [Polyangiaceae bacterium]
MRVARLPLVQDTLQHMAAARARSLCEALDLAHRAQELEALCGMLMAPWGAGRVQRPPDYLSHVVDDGTPFEFSIALSERAEVRFLVEPLGNPPSLVSNATATETVLERLAREFGVDLTRYLAIRDLFWSERPAGPFTLWLAAALGAEGPPSFKLYLNPAVHGSIEAPQVIEAALHRLGFDAAWPAIGNVLAWRGPEADELKYFSLDLSPGPEARVKVYARHHHATRDVVASAAGACSSGDPESISLFLRTLAPDVDLYEGRGPFTCYAFTAGSGSAPDSVTTHFPINGYAQSDQEAQERILLVHDAFGLPNAPYIRALSAIAERPLDSGVGTHSYVSLRTKRGRTRLTLYLPSEAYAPGTVEDPRDAKRSSGQRPRSSGLPGASPEHHPLFARLRRDPPDERLLWVLSTNVRVALEPLTRQAPDLADAVREPWLQELLRGTPDLTRLGGLDLRTHEQWLLRVGCEMAMREQVAPASSLLSPALQFSERVSCLVASERPYLRAGAALANALFSGDLCKELSALLRDSDEYATTVANRLPTLPAPAFTLYSLAEFANAEAEQDLRSGITRYARAAWILMNDLYATAFGAAPDALFGDD